jgi:hypothetical protein
MVKFATRLARAIAQAQIKTVGTRPDTYTYEGGAGFSRDPKSELFLLAVTNMVGEATFYEAAADRDERFRMLVEKVAAQDPAWIAAFVPYLRDTMQMRSASVVMAAEFARARLAQVKAEGSAQPKVGQPAIRSVVASALSRADEPAEMIAYWHGRYGRRLPQPIKRGVADAARRLYTERAALKYDGDTRGYRMADVVELAHADPIDARQSALFRYLLEKRHNRERIEVNAETLPVIAARRELEAIPQAERRELLVADGFADRLQAAGATWEWLSGWLNGPMDAAAWEAVIPSMGYMALLRNLRNFEEAKVSERAQAAVAAKLADADEVVRSRQLPLRFYSAYKNTGTLTYGPAIEKALDRSLANVPALRGRTLVMVDVSGSMVSPLSGRGSALRWEAAAVFAAALAARAEKADLVAFDTTSRAIEIRPGDSILRTVEKVKPFVGGGTETFRALRDNYRGQDRVIILTDEQAFADARSGKTPGEDVKVPIYTFNLAGYRAGHLPSGGQNRYTFGGLTDQGFLAIELLECGVDAGWPFIGS